MKLDIEGIGKINHASIEINTITVIAGENNTGKSTVGKVLYSVFKSFYNLDNKVKQFIHDRIERELDLGLQNPFDDIYENDQTLSFMEYILKNKDAILSIADLKKIAEGYDIHKNFNCNFNNIFRYLKLTTQEIYDFVLQSNLEAEFGKQLKNFAFKSKESSVVLNVKGKEVKAIVNNELCNLTSKPFSFDRDIFYIDSPFLLDDIMFYSDSPISHRYETGYKIKRSLKKSSMENAVDALVTNKRLEKIYEKINSACSGSLMEKNRGFVYFDKEINSEMKMCNVSTGLKSFIILKTILSNGLLSDKGLLILDEPEIHLHPEWQILFAEIIVLLQKEFNLHILINSHSPYFIDAIDVYSKKYGIKDDVRFYLTEKVDIFSVNIADYSKNLEPIYKLLTRPLQKLEKERYGKLYE